MAGKIVKLSALALLASASVLSAAQAGGFARGTADTDILYEDGNFNLRAGVTYVNPTRKYTAHGNAALIGTSSYDAYSIPSAAIKLNINDDLRCAGTVTQPLGGSASFAAPTPSGKLAESFSITEIGATCGYKFDLSKGRAWFIGGLFSESFDYDRTNATPVGLATLGLGGTEVGYRIGAAYEIPEIALRAQLMYRSGTSYGADGILTLPTAVILARQATAAANAGNLVLAAQLQAQAQAAALAGLKTDLPATGAGTMPQSVEMKLQSGIAPGWLAFGSIKWTDWSVTEQLIVDSAAATEANDYFWKDGWTVTAGVGHAFTEKFSGAAQITWDSGVGTGYDLSSDTWTFGVGGSLKDDMGGELRFAGGLTYITGASTVSALTGSPVEAVGAGWAYALSASYKTKW